MAERAIGSAGECKTDYLGLVAIRDYRYPRGVTGGTIPNLLRGTYSQRSRGEAREPGGFETFAPGGR